MVALRPMTDPRLKQPAFRLQVVLEAHRSTLLWLAAECERWRWECERLRQENSQLRQARFERRRASGDQYLSLPVSPYGGNTE